MKTINTYLLTLLLFSFGMISCNEEKGDLVFSGGKFAAVSLNKPPVDAATLKIYNISVAKVKKGDTWLGSLSYEADGGSDYVEFKACHESGKCFDGKSALNRVLMPPFALGNITITARACTDSGRSTSSASCGPDSTGTFLQPGNANSTQAQLMSERASRVEQLKSFGAIVKETLETYQREIEECQVTADRQDELQAKKQMISGFIALGESLISVALSVTASATAPDPASVQGPKDFVGPPRPTVANGGIKSAAPDGSKPVNQSNFAPVKNATQDSATRLENYDGYMDVTAGAFASVGLFNQQKPVSAIQSIGGSIFDLMHSDEIQRFPCMAEQKASTEMGAIKKQMEKLRTEIAAIDSQLTQFPGTL